MAKSFLAIDFLLSAVLGVDTILQKTQEDLGRIKKTSYFQRKKADTPTPSEESKSIVSPTGQHINSGDVQPGKAPKWIGFEEGSRQEEGEEDQSTESGARAEEAQPEAPQENIPEEAEEEEDQVEEDDDIFNTEYVDVVTSGELKLAYVPEDDPTEDQGEDPFDTSVVEKIVGPLPVIKKKRELVSIGAAAQVLSAANAAGAPISVVRRREVQPPTEIQLLGCLDDEEPRPRPRSTASTPCTNSRPGSVPATPQQHRETPVGNAVPVTPDLKDIIAEFDLIPESAGEGVEDELIEKPPVKPPAPPAPEPAASGPPELLDEEDFEFEALAYESLAKNPQQFLPAEAEEEDDPFDTSSVDKVLKTNPVETAGKSSKPPPPRPVAPPPSRPRPSPARPAPAKIAPIDPAKVLSAPAQQQKQQPEPPQPAPLKAQDSFDALFLDDSPSKTEPEKEPLPVPEPPAPVEEDDPFDTSVADKLCLPVVTAAVTSSVTFPAEVEEAVAEEEEVDPFDTSAVEKILN